MNSLTLPLWFKEISFQRNNGIISNGLTIPYLVGSYNICEVPLGNRPIQSLFFEIIEFSSNKCAVLQFCTNIHQYVIGVDDRDYCEVNMKNNIKFRNSLSETSLFITQNANDLGNDLNQVIIKFENMYAEMIASSKFSWNSHTKRWEEFTSEEMQLIKKAK